MRSRFTVSDPLKKLVITRGQRYHCGMQKALRVFGGTVLMVAAVAIGFQALRSAEVPGKQIHALQMDANLATSPPGDSTIASAGIMRNGPDIVVTFEAGQGATYRLERKLNITDPLWQSIPGVNDLTAANTGPAQITDPGAVSLGTAFYRVNPTRFPLAVTKTGTGTVTSSPAGINCGASCTASFDTGASVTLQARTVNGSNAFFSGWTGDCASAGSSRDCTVSMTQSRTVGATFSAMTNNVIFASSRTYIGALAIGSVANADSECNTLATAAGINDAAGNGFIAFISSSTSNAFQRLSPTPRGWVRMDGKPVFDSQAAITAGQIWHPINRNEFGQVVTSDGYVATGMNGDGSTAALTCMDWSGAGSFGAFGNVNNGPGAWIQENNFGCNFTLRLYCMGKTKTVALTPAPFAGPAKYLFVSNATVGPNSVTGPAEFDAVCNAEKPAGSGTFKALVASTGSAASSLVSSTTNYMTIQRLFIGTGAEITSASFFASGAGMWEHSNFSFPTPTGPLARVYTGSASPVALGSAQTTCNDWGSTMGNGTYGLYQMGRDRWWGFNVQACNLPAHVHCIEQ